MAGELPESCLGSTLAQLAMARWAAGSSRAAAATRAPLLPSLCDSMLGRWLLVSTSQVQLAAREGFDHQVVAQQVSALRCRPPPAAPCCYRFENKSGFKLKRPDSAMPSPCLSSRGGSRRSSEVDFVSCQMCA